MLQTDMQLSSIYLVSELAAAMLKIHGYIVGCYAQLRLDVFCAFLRYCFYPLLEIGCQHCTMWSRTDGRSAYTHAVNSPLLMLASCSRLVARNISWATGWPTLTSYSYTELVAVDCLVLWQSMLTATEFGETFYIWSDMRHLARMCRRSPSFSSTNDSKCRELQHLTQTATSTSSWTDFLLIIQWEWH